MQDASTTEQWEACLGERVGCVFLLCASTVPEGAAHDAKQAQQQESHTCKQLFALSEKEFPLHVLPVLVDHEVPVFFIHLQANQRRGCNIFCH